MLTQAQQEYFDSKANKFKQCFNVYMPIVALDHSTIKGHTESLGIAHSNNKKMIDMISIDESFIAESFQKEVEGKLVFIPCTLEYVIAHELAHAISWKHGKKHNEAMQRLLEKVTIEG